MAMSNGIGTVKSLEIGESNASKPPFIKGETFNDYNPSLIVEEHCIV